MTKRVLWVVGLLLGLAGCGDSEGSDDDKLSEANQFRAERVAAIGDYCCYVNGTATAESPDECRAGARDCLWSETYNDVDDSGRGTMCGYLACQ